MKACVIWTHGPIWEKGHDDCVNSPRNAIAMEFVQQLALSKKKTQHCWILANSWKLPQIWEAFLFKQLYEQLCQDWKGFKAMILKYNRDFIQISNLYSIKVLMCLEASWAKIEEANQVEDGPCHLVWRSKQSSLQRV